MKLTEDNVSLGAGGAARALEITEAASERPTDRELTARVAEEVSSTSFDIPHGSGATTCGVM